VNKKKKERRKERKKERKNVYLSSLAIQHDDGYKSTMDNRTITIKRYSAAVYR
jgi:hypothetical protein